MYKKFILFWIMASVLITSLVPMTSLEANDEAEYFFSFTIVAPNTSPRRPHIPILLFQEDAAKIGIEISIKYHNWVDIMDRTYSHSAPIPTYEEGGYDALHVGWLLSNHEPWDGYELFLSTKMPLAGYNIYQFNNSEYEYYTALYSKSYDITERTIYLEKIQEILYEELPTLVYAYPYDIIVFRDTVEIDNFDLMEQDNFVENWRDKNDQTLAIGIVDLINYVNPFQKRYWYNGLLMSAIYGQLFRISPANFMPVPEVALDYELKNNNTDIVVHLNPNATFSDGTPVTAEDVKYSYDMHFNHDFSEYSKELEMAFGSNNSIEIVDNQTVVFHLLEPTIFFMQYLRLPIVCKAKVESLIELYGRDILTFEPFDPRINDSLVFSCGPYILSYYNYSARYPNQTALLIPNPYWFMGEPPEDNISLISCLAYSTMYEAYIQNELDVLTQYYGNLTEIETLPNTIIKRTPSLSYSEIALNMKHPVFGTGELTPKGTIEAAKLVRKALNHIINREKAINERFYGLAYSGVTPIPPGVMGFNEKLEPYAYNLSLAKELLEQAGYKNNTATTTTVTSTSSTESVISTKADFNITIFSLLGLCTLVYLAKRKR